MHYRQLGRSGLRVSVLTLGTMTFGGKGVFAKTGETDLAGAKRLVDRCIEAGINLFDTADVYPGACRRRSWARRCRAGAARSWSPPRRG